MEEKKLNLVWDLYGIKDNNWDNLTKEILKYIFGDIFVVPIDDVSKRCKVIKKYENLNEE